VYAGALVHRVALIEIAYVSLYISAYHDKPLCYKLPKLFILTGPSLCLDVGTNQTNFHILQGLT